MVCLPNRVGGHSILGPTLPPAHFFCWTTFRMDFSQYIRLKNEAANKYVSRTKTVDSSFLTLQRQQKAAYSGYNDIQYVRYYNGSPVVNNAFVNTLVNFKNPGDTIDAPMKMGYSSANRQSQHEDLASRNAGGVVCNQPDYSKVARGNELLNCNQQTTILNEYANKTSINGNTFKAYGYGEMPGTWKPYGNGINTFFPPGDTCSRGVCKKDPLYPS